jgi:hypothetical protein
LLYPSREYILEGAGNINMDERKSEDLLKFMNNLLRGQTLTMALTT